MVTVIQFLAPEVTDIDDCYEKSGFLPMIIMVLWHNHLLHQDRWLYQTTVRLVDLRRGMLAVQRSIR